MANWMCCINHDGGRRPSAAIYIGYVHRWWINGNSDRIIALCINRQTLISYQINIDHLLQIFISSSSPPPPPPTSTTTTTIIIRFPLPDCSPFNHSMHLQCTWPTCWASVWPMTYDRWPRQLPSYYNLKNGAKERRNVAVGGCLLRSFSGLDLISPTSAALL